MSVALAPSNDPTGSKSASRPLDVNGAAEISFVHKDGETGLGRLYYRDPLKVLFPRGDVPTATLVTTGGGLFGGDTYDIRVDVKEQAHCLVTAQAAEKVYRSSGPDCLIDVNLNVEKKACLEWLPQETILFDQARFRRTTKLNIDTGAQALVGEMIVFGRLASGEEVQDGLLREAWEVRKNNKLVWADALHIDGAFEGPLDHMSGFGGARATATAIYSGPEMNDILETARSFFCSFEEVKMGASLVNDILICRWLAKDPYALRKAFGGFWSQFRNKAMGRASSLPRLWHC